MIHYRPFSNTDPPLLAELWRSCANRPLVQPLTAAMLEELVLNKPYFDREGLWLAVEDDKPQGFVHAGFGPSEDESTLSTDFSQKLLAATIEDLLAVEGVGEARARGIREGLSRLAETSILDRYS